MPKIAFVGLGAMGSAMAQRLLAAGHSVTGYNRTRAKAEALDVSRASPWPTPPAPRWRGRRWCSAW